MSTEATAPVSEAQPADVQPTQTSTTDAASSSAPESSSNESGSWLDHLDNVFGDEPVEEPKETDEKPNAETPESSESSESKLEKESSDESESDSQPETEPKNMSAEARRAFKEYRVKNRELSKQLDSLKSELSKLKESPSSTTPPQEVSKLEEENKSLKAQVEEMTSELSTVAVEATPQYKAEVIKPLVDTLRSVGALSERYSVSKRLLERAIEESAETGAPTEELTDAASAMNSFDQQELHLLVRGMRTVMERKAWYRENSKNIAEQRQREQSEKAAAQDEARRDAVLSAAEDVWERLSELPPVKNMPEADRIKAYETAKNAVLTLEKAPEDLRSYSVFAAALFPNVLKQMKASQAKVKELESSLAKYTKAKPKAGAGESDGGLPQVPEGMSFLDAIEAGIT
jgi:hypothetical protein